MCAPWWSALCAAMRRLSRRATQPRPPLSQLAARNLENDSRFGLRRTHDDGPRCEQVLAIIRPNLDGVLAVRRQELKTQSSEQLETVTPLVIHHRFGKLVVAGVRDRRYLNVD